MKKESIKIDVYEPQIGKGGYVKSSVTQPLMSELGATENPYIQNGVVHDDSARNVFLRGNPFLYNSKTAIYQITSIEEYLIKAYKNEIAFGDVLRNPDFSPRKRKRIIKTAFKVWNKDYTNKKNSAFKESDKIVEVIGDVNYLTFSRRTKLIMYFLFILMLFIVGTTSVLWRKIIDNSIVYYINTTLKNMFIDNNWIKVVGNITIYVILIMIFYSTIYTLISKDFKNNYRLAQNFLERSETTISKDYKRKWKKARRYYLSLINDKKRPYFAPLDMSKVEEGQVNITTFNNITQATIDRAYKLKKRKPLIIAIKNLLLFSSMGGSTLVIAFSLYKLFIGIFKN